MKASGSGGTSRFTTLLQQDRLQIKKNDAELEAELAELGEEEELDDEVFDEG